MADEVSTIFHNHDLGKTSGITVAQDSDFVGFRFGGVHSSDLGIKRVSDGSRYNEDLLPSLQDKTVQIPGGDGTYYFGSYYTQRTIPVSIAFDDMTEVQFRKLRTLISKKEPQRLIFDERPYKYYMAKVSPSAQSLKYVCFEKDDGQRRYCGEGNLNFICYFPFARATNWVLSEFSNEDKKNINQWEEASGIPKNIDDDDPKEKLYYLKSSKRKNGDTSFYIKGDTKGCSTWRDFYWSRVETRTTQTNLGDSGHPNYIWHFFSRLINPGDKETPFILEMGTTFGNDSFNISLVNEQGIEKSFAVKLPSSNLNNIVIDSGKQLIYLKQNPKTILALPESGEFFNIPVIEKTDSPMWLKIGFNAYLQDSAGSIQWGTSDLQDCGKVIDYNYKIEMDYLYL